MTIQYSLSEPNKLERHPSYRYIFQPGLKHSLAKLPLLEAPQQISKHAAVSSESFGRIDILINNAGYSFMCDIAELSEENLERA
ncbi:hypothetical protein F4775DRAFT_597491 [Biscogniauxia sp. FL1348]|nr:hypothetical protein F4775DRAFT_597491 [Biscogniauxia sp. FL1348]